MIYEKAEKRLAEARTYLDYARPYYATGLHALKTIVTTEVPSFAVDTWWRLYVNPGWVERYPVPRTATALCHELQHLLLDHGGRAVTVGVTHETMALWNNEAADPDINDGLLVDCQTCRPILPTLPEEWCVLPKHFGLPDGHTAEWYFAKRMSDRIERAGAGEAKENGGAGNGGSGRAGRGSGRGDGDAPQLDFGCGSGATGVPAPWEVGSPEESGVQGLDAVDAWDVRRRVAEAVTAHATGLGRGTAPEGLLEWAEDMLRPARISWEQALRSVMRRARQTVAGSVRRSYARTSRRQHAFGNVIMPAFRRPKPNVTFVCDTSFSMNEQRALVRGVVEDACRQLAVPLRVIDVDESVQREVIVRSGRKAAHQGNGGTDMRVGIAQALKRPNAADCVVVCTDCDTPWPDAPPGVHVIVAAIGAKQEHLAAIPPWATLIEVQHA